MNYFYTNKNLVDILPVDSKSFIDCGMSNKNIIQITCEGVVHSFIDIIDETIFKSLLKIEVNYMTEAEVEAKVKELKVIEAKEIEEYKKTQPEYKISELEKDIETLKKENADLNFALLNGGVM